jgi:hypothetical protein
MMTMITGDEYFPGGLGTFTAEQNEFLVFEDGPSVDVELQWARYQDAADESSLSRIWGGIHPPCDDIPGRIVAQVIAGDAFSKAEEYFFPCSSSPAQPGTITGSNRGLCNKTNVSYSVPYVTGVVYTWTVPAGAVITSGQGTNAIKVNFGVNSGDVSVYASNSCGNSIVKSKAVKTTPATPGAITGPALVCANQQNVSYSIAAVANSTSYKWTGPAGSVISDGIITSGNNILTTDSTNVTVDFAGTAGDLKVRAINACGQGSNKSMTIAFNCRLPQSTASFNPPAVNIFPNPANDLLNISVTVLLSAHCKIILTNPLGQTLVEKEVSAGNGSVETQLALSELPSGIYFLVVAADETHQVFKVQKLRSN